MIKRGQVLSKTQYVGLSDVRFQLARLRRFSEQATRAAEITEAQYPLLLQIRGFRRQDWATVGELAIRLQASPHGTAALIKRCVALRLMIRRRNAADARCVEVGLAPRGDKLVRRIALQHRNELRLLRNALRIEHVSR